VPINISERRLASDEANEDSPRHWHGNYRKMEEPRPPNKCGHEKTTAPHFRAEGGINLPSVAIQQASNFFCGRRIDGLCRGRTGESAGAQCERYAFASPWLTEPGSVTRD
jgi:hypothetical protein